MTHLTLSALTDLISQNLTTIFSREEMVTADVDPDDPRPEWMKVSPATYNQNERFEECEQAGTITITGGARGRQMMRTATAELDDPKLPRVCGDFGDFVPKGDPELCNSISLGHLIFDTYIQQLDWPIEGSDKPVPFAQSPIMGEIERQKFSPGIALMKYDPFSLLCGGYDGGARAWCAEYRVVGYGYAKGGRGYVKKDPIGIPSGTMVSPNDDGYLEVDYGTKSKEPSKHKLGAVLGSSAKELAPSVWVRKIEAQAEIDVRRLRNYNRRNEKGVIDRDFQQKCLALLVAIALHGLVAGPFSETSFRSGCSVGLVRGKPTFKAKLGSSAKVAAEFTLTVEQAEVLVREAYAPLKDALRWEEHQYRLNVPQTLKSVLSDSEEKRAAKVKAQAEKKDAADAAKARAPKAKAPRNGKIVAQA